MLWLLQCLDGESSSDESPSKYAAIIFSVGIVDVIAYDFVFITSKME
jgi:hypothetical protein